MPRKKLAKDAKRVARKVSPEKRRELDKVIELVEREVPPKPVSAARVALAQLRNARQQRGLTLEQLAKATGMTKTNLSRLETGSENVTVKTLERYAEGLGGKLQISVLGIAPPKPLKRG
ncbi:MAG: helix-turn-helix transcriptional regulator [Planctomycetota bacterium]